MTRIKICGITNLEDAHRAIDMGADALGFIFAESPRRISPQMARKIIASLPPFVSRIGVFVDEDLQAVREAIDFCRLDMVQFHGDKCLENQESFSQSFIKAYSVKDWSVLEEIRAHNFRYFLLDTSHATLRGGTGQTFDWDIAREANSLGHVILSGGLNPQNVREALACARPYAVDVCGGVEARPGIKDHAKMQKFIEEVKNWDSRKD